MNQGKLEVVKQEMARVNVDILGIRELRWTRMGKFNSDDHYIYNCGQESLRRNGAAVTGDKSPKCSTYWDATVGSQETPGVTGKFGLGVQNEAGQRLIIEFCQENALAIAKTLFQQHKRRLYTWTSPDGQYQSQTDYILCSQR